MACLFGVAVGLSIVTIDPAWWEDGLLVAASTWIVLGLAAQTRDLVRAYRQRRPASADARWGWQFAILWRVAIMGLLTANYVVDCLEALGSWHLPYSADCNDFWYDPRPDACELCLLIVICPTPGRSLNPAFRPLARLYGTLGVLSAVILCLIVVVDLQIVPALIHFATAGIDLAQPGEYSQRAVALYGPRRTSDFFWWCVGANAVVLVGLLMIRPLATHWTRGKRTRIILGSLVALCLGITVANTLWLTLTGFGQVSPYLAETLWLGPPYRAIMIGLLVVLFVTAAAWRWVQLPDGARQEPIAPAGRERRPYYHERWPVLLVTGAGILAEHFAWLFPPESLSDLLENLFYTHTPYLPLAILWVVVARIFAGWFGRRDDRPWEPLPLPRAQFAVVWASLAVLVLFGTPLLAALGFAFWIRPG